MLDRDIFVQGYFRLLGEEQKHQRILDSIREDTKFVIRKIRELESDWEPGQR